MRNRYERDIWRTNIVLISILFLVSPDRVNWFLYDFEVDDGLFEDEKFVQIFKKYYHKLISFNYLFICRSLIQKIAAKYILSPSQITVSSIEQNGLTSFQIMPFFDENTEEFDQKMDQIDADVGFLPIKSWLFLFPLFFLVEFTRISWSSTIRCRCHWQW